MGKRVTERTRKAQVETQEPLVAIVGRPNVGKSTLFNRLSRRHDAIVEDLPGVTRDRRYGRAEYDGLYFRIVDTGGIDLDERAADSIKKGVEKQALFAVDEAALVLFVIDGMEGVLPADREIASRLRKSGKKVLYVANKVDSERRGAAANDLYALGAQEVYGISAAHGRGLPDLLDALVSELVAQMPEVDAPKDNNEDEILDGPEDQEGPENDIIRVALIGRPNAGKSSLVNALCGEERMIVDPTPGTTRDPVDTLIEEKGGQKYLLLDTAGIRRRVRVHEAADRVAMAMAEKAIERADVAVLVVDAHAGIGEQDARIAGLVQDAGRALVLAFNKYDLLKPSAETEARVSAERERILHFVSWAPQVFCSAQSGHGLSRLLSNIQSCFAAYKKRVPTGELNRLFARMVEEHPPPLFKGQPIRLYYITQAQSRPPTFVVSVNHPEGMHFSYRRFLANRLRETFELSGTPLRLIAKKRGRGSKDDG